MASNKNKKVYMWILTIFLIANNGRIYRYIEKDFKTKAECETKAKVIETDLKKNRRGQVSWSCEPIDPIYKNS
jgi:hypothetical protein